MMEDGPVLILKLAFNYCRIEDALLRFPWIADCAFLGLSKLSSHVWVVGGWLGGNPSLCMLSDVMMITNYALKLITKRSKCDGR